MLYFNSRKLPCIQSAKQSTRIPNMAQQNLGFPKQKPDIKMMFPNKCTPRRCMSCFTAHPGLGNVNLNDEMAPSYPKATNTNPHNKHNKHNKQKINKTQRNKK